MEDSRMDRFLKKTQKIVFSEQSGIFSSALIISAMIIISGIFGFLRYRILAGYFTTDELDVYFASFRLPDLVFEILITGALTSSFIPIFIKYQKNKAELERHVSSIFNLLMLVLTVIVIILYFSMDWITPLITPGFKGTKLEEVITFSKLLLLSQLPFLVAGNFLTGIAQARKTFLITSIAPVLYNLTVIISTLLFAQQIHLYAPVLGVSVGSVLFFIIQIPTIFNFDITYHPIIHMTEGVREFFKMIGPRIMTVVITQIDATIDLSLTSLLGSGAYTTFYFAQRLQLLPVSIVGVAFGQASLPYLSEMIEQDKITEFQKVILDSLLNLFFFTVPIMVFFIFARTPIIRIFFGGEKYDWDATVQTAFALSYFALSLPFHAVYYFLTRCFYALLDSKTPFVISLITIAINTGLSLFFILVMKLPVWSLAVSFSVSIILNSTILFGILIIRLKQMDLKYFFKEGTKIMAASLVASPAAYYLIKLMDKLLLDTTRTINVLFMLAVSTTLYFLLYLLVSWLLDTKAIYEVTQLFVKSKGYPKKITEITSYE